MICSLYRRASGGRRRGRGLIFVCRCIPLCLDGRCVQYFRYLSISLDCYLGYDGVSDLNTPHSIRSTVDTRTLYSQHNTSVTLKRRYMVMDIWDVNEVCKIELYDIEYAYI